MLTAVVVRLCGLRPPASVSQPGPTVWCKMNAVAGCNMSHVVLAQIVIFVITTEHHLVTGGCRRFSSEAEEKPEYMVIGESIYFNLFSLFY